MYSLSVAIKFVRSNYSNHKGNFFFVSFLFDFSIYDYFGASHKYVNNFVYKFFLYLFMNEL